MFLVSSKEQVSQFDNLLQYYYNHLCRFIKDLGSDPAELFPQSKFREHWKKFSFIGLCFVFAILEFTLVDQNEVQDFNFRDKEEMTENLIKAKPKNFHLYMERVTSVTKYYFDLTDH